MVFDGKVVGQPTKFRFNSGNPLPTCSKCNKLIDKPTTIGINMKSRMQLVFSYLDTKYYIYESKSGFSIVYCSEYCRNKHNHRFVKL